MSDSDNSNHSPNKLKRLKRNRQETPGQIDPDQQLFNMVDASDVKIKKVKKEEKYAKRLLNMFQEFRDGGYSSIKKKLKKEKAPQEKKKIDEQRFELSHQQQREKKEKLIKKKKIENPQLIQQESKTIQKDEKIDQQIQSPNKQNIQQADQQSHEKLKSKKKKQRKDSSQSFIQEQQNEQQSYSQYTEGGKRVRMIRRKKQQLKKKIIQKHKIWQQKFQVEQKEQNFNTDYITGMEYEKNRNNNSKNMIRSKNRLFQQFSLKEKQEAQPNKEQNNQQNTQVDIQPIQIKKQITQYNFLAKVSNIRKSRGIINQNSSQQYSNTVTFAQEESLSRSRNKASLCKLISNSSFKQDQDLDLSVRIPCLTKGKSTSLFNSTIFLKKMSMRQQGESQKFNTNIFERINQQKKKPIGKKNTSKTRQQIIKSYLNKVKQQKSKYISSDQIRGSFKKTGLQQLQILKKKNEEQRFKEINAFMNDQDDEQYIPPGQNNKQLILQKQKQQNNVAKQVQNIIESNLNQKQNSIHTQLLIEQKQKIILQNKSIQQKQNHQVLNQKQIQKISQQIQQQQKKINQQEYQRLLALEAGQEQEEQEQQIQQIGDQQDIQADNQKEDQQGSSIQNLTQKQKNQEIQVQQIQNNQDKQFINDKNQQLKEFQDLQKGVSIIQQVQKGEKGDQNKKLFRKLKRIAVEIAARKKKKQEFNQRVAQFLDQEAQLGSDNQQNDFKKKYIDKQAQQKQFQGVNLDAQLQQLIDNAVYLNQSDQQQAYQKFLRDQRIRQKQELKKIIRGEFRKSKRDLVNLEFDQDQQKRQMRMQQMMDQLKKREIDQQNLYVNSQKQDQIQQKQQSEEDNEFIRQVQQQLKKIRAPTNNSFSQFQFFGTQSKLTSSKSSSNSNSIFPKNRNSLLNMISDKNRITSFSIQNQDKNNKPKSNVNKLYQKAVMASKKVVVFGMNKSKPQVVL